MILDVERREDDRGFLARTYCVDELGAHGLALPVVQASTVVTHRRGTVRGLHFQRAPHAEKKLIRCTAGAAFVVAVDLRDASSTRRQWHGVVLSHDNRRQLFVPEGFAQGYQTLAEETELHYQMSHRFVPEAASGVRWNDPAFGIGWPEPMTAMSDRDREWPLLASEQRP
jgi:dTDP-4-dehydrorhamnose 3,5-epimerase